MHFNRALMGLKNDESSEESFRGNADSQHFINKGGVLPLLSTRVCDNIPRTASETSNLISVTSSHDSFSENAESKANLRSSDTFDASEDVEMSPKFFGGTGTDDQPPLKPVCVSDQGTILNKYEDTRGVEGHDDNISCISGANDAKLEAETDKGKGDLPDEALKCSEKTELVKKFNESVELPDKSLSGDESDESDIVEHDVKVCDICGDAGREDLLAICSKCSDGAEHTYCMRDMLDKVPEGKWLCEECKFAEETEKHKQAKVEIMNGNVKNLLSGQTLTQHTDLSVKLDTRESNVEGDRTNIVSPSSQLSRKRRTDNIEADSTAKRQALETIAESPKAYNPSRTAALTRDCSFKNLDKGKVKPAHQTSLGAHSFNDNLETARIATTSPRLQPPKGALLKSNSFSSLKPKVKLEDDNVSHKLKLAREPASLDTKEGPVRMIGKSMSFKSAYAGRSSVAESKVKMLSPKFSHVQDSKGLKRAKEWFTSERKTLKVDQKSMSGSNNRDLKAQSDGKFSTSSKPSGHLACKGAEIPAPLAGASSTNGTCSSLEQKLNQNSPMDETSSEMGHATQSCTIGSPRGSAIDASSARSSREEMNKDNILKAAIQAAMLKKPGVYKKNRVPDQADTSSLDLNSERAPHDQVSVSSYSRNMISAEGAHDGQTIIQGCSSDSGKQKNIIDVKQLSMHCPDPVHSIKTGELDSIVSFDGKSISSDLSSHASVATSVPSKMPVIPEHEYVWQGDFEVYRSGTFPDLQGGIQAHLSTCSSPKVAEVVKKFPNKIPLTEVPRLSTWPTQFHNSGATENDIALYFFAKDFESYERNYKVLLESMVKNDLALKGNLDGIELLIFPSNRLPEKSQRWNMLSFVWGVFRARRVSCLDHIPSSSDKFDIPGSNVVMVEKDISSAIMSMPENLCSSGRINESSEHERPCDSNTSASLKSPILSPPAKINGDYDPKPSSPGQRFSCLQAKSEQHYSRRDYQSSSRISTSSVQVCPESRWTTTSLRGNDEPECKPDMEKGNNEPECKPDLEPQTHVEARGTNSGSNKCEKIAIHLDSSNNEGSTSSSTKIFSVGPEEAEDKLNRERPILDIIQTTSQASSSGRSDIMPWNNSLGDENVGKKQKTGFGEIFGLENTRKDKMDVVDDTETSERYFFPVESPLGFGGDINSMPWKNKEVRIHDEVPNLELALGKQGIFAPPPKQGILPFFIGAAGREKKNNEREKSPDKVITEDEEESASLSLSLSFPFPDEERSVKPSSKVNTSLILFGDFSDK